MLVGYSCTVATGICAALAQSGGLVHKDGTRMAHGVGVVFDKAHGMPTALELGGNHAFGYAARVDICVPLSAILFNVAARSARSGRSRLCPQCTGHQPYADRLCEKRQSATDLWHSFAHVFWVLLPPPKKRQRSKEKRSE